MTISARLGRFVTLAASVAASIALACSAPVAAEQRQFSKDVGPANAACDAHQKGSAAWSACVGVAKAGISDTELFYAGYWLAKSGQYNEALQYLKLANIKDERVLTYIGFATRKLGDVDAALPLYRKALEINPNYSVARAYMGEAFLTKEQPEEARAQLAEIAQRCGATCPEYVDLDNHIHSYEVATSKKG
ncbi:MAG: tetratricopeptide repeat protein [Hyphomicrobium sp.]|jgi:tetratricopeptide (TPR) repeat protein